MLSQQAIYLYVIQPMLLIQTMKVVGVIEGRGNRIVERWGSGSAAH